jgi:uncharacterized OB-fold protein
MQWDWKEALGRGNVWSFSVIRRDFGLGLGDEIPFITVLVQLEENPDIHFVSRLVECTHEEVQIGMPVAVKFVPLGESVVLPYFRPFRG